MIPISEGGLGAYWMARREDADACASRMGRCLDGLSAINPAFASWWYTKDRTRAKASSDPALLRELLLAGRNRKDFPPRDVIEELGFQASLITSHSLPEQLNLRVACGMYSPDPNLVNHCLLKLAPAGDLSYEAVPRETKDQALEVLIQSWDPDWAALRSRRLSKAVQEARRNRVVQPYFGWITFISKRRGNVPPSVREKYVCREFATAGVIIYLTQQVFDDQNPELVQSAVDLYGILEEANLLSRSAPIDQRTM